MTGGCEPQSCGLDRADTSDAGSTPAASTRRQAPHQRKRGRRSRHLGAQGRALSAERVDVEWLLSYDSYMSDLAVSEARDHLADVIEQARRSGEPVYVTRRGRRVAVIVDADVYDRIVEAAEDAVDRRELEAARAENDYVPWDAVKADLGLR